MGLSAPQYFILLSVIILAFATDFLVGKRNRDRHGNGNGAKDKLKVAEDTCVNGYCLDPTYNKLELPSTKKSHVRINLEVIMKVHKAVPFFYVVFVEIFIVPLLCTLSNII